MATRRRPQRKTPPAKKAAPVVTTEGPSGLEWARCRSLGHEWTHGNRSIGDSSSGVYAFVSTCEFCGSTRTKYISRSGALGDSRYEYPKTYSQHGDERMSTLEWRRSFVVTVFGA